MESILSQFLAAGLLPIGEDDSKLSLLDAAAVELARQIGSNHRLAYRFALIGLDNRIKATDPVFGIIEGAVRAKWNTITNKVGANPIQIYRAVILRALQIATDENPVIGEAFMLSARNEPTLHISDAERKAVTSMIQEIEEEVAAEVRDVWISPFSTNLPKLSIKAKKASTSKDELSVALARATGPVDQAGLALTNANPYAPDAGQAWSNEFVKRASEAIYAAIQGSSKASIDELQESIRGSMTDLVRGIERLTIRDAKSELLWIRASLYSPSARTNYQSLAKSELLLHAALDISRVVASTAPPSVEFFLRDLLSALSNDAADLETVLTEIGPKLSLLPEAQLIADAIPAIGRRPWLSIAIKPSKDISFEEQAGVASGYTEPLPDLAVRFYRELQIWKLLSIDT